MDNAFISLFRVVRYYSKMSSYIIIGTCKQTYYHNYRPVQQHTTLNQFLMSIACITSHDWFSVVFYELCYFHVGSTVQLTNNSKEVA